MKSEVCTPSGFSEGLQEVQFVVQTSLPDSPTKSEHLGSARPVRGHVHSPSCLLELPLCIFLPAVLLCGRRQSENTLTSFKMLEVFLSSHNISLTQTALNSFDDVGVYTVYHGIYEVS